MRLCLLAGLPNPEWNEDNDNRYGKVDRERQRGLNLTHSYRQLRNAEGRRNAFPQGRAHHLISNA